jgi:hypothetical protein
MLTAKEEIAELLAFDLAHAGKDLEMLRELEDFLEPMKKHPLVKAAMKKISQRIFSLELEIKKERQ